MLNKVLLYCIVLYCINNCIARKFLELLYIIKSDVIITTETLLDNGLLTMNYSYKTACSKEMTETQVEVVYVFMSFIISAVSGELN